MPESTSSASIPTDEAETSSEPGRISRWLVGTSAEGFIIRMVVYPTFVYVLIFVIGFAWAYFFPEGAANFLAYFRNLLEIILALSAIIIFVATGILIVQLARFINLLRSEIKPITDDTKEAVKNIRITAEFVQKHGIAPIIRIQSFLAGLFAFFVELVRITRILQQREESDGKAEEFLSGDGVFEDEQTEI